MTQHEYKCQSCFHRDVCPEYHPETYSCVHHVDEADVTLRAEVAREIFAEMDKVLLPVMNSIYPVEVYIKLKKKHLAATGTDDSGKDMI